MLPDPELNLPDPEDRAEFERLVSYVGPILMSIAHHKLPTGQEVHEIDPREYIFLAGQLALGMLVPVAKLLHEKTGEDGAMKYLAAWMEQFTAQLQQHARLDVGVEITGGEA